MYVVEFLSTIVPETRLYNANIVNVIWVGNNFYNGILQNNDVRVFKLGKASSSNVMHIKLVFSQQGENTAWLRWSANTVNWVIIRYLYSFEKEIVDVTRWWQWMSLNGRTHSNVDVRRLGRKHDGPCDMFLWINSVLVQGNWPGGEMCISAMFPFLGIRWSTEKARSVCKYDCTRPTDLSRILYGLFVVWNR